MSESDKMGLFGSKDENNESTTDEIKNDDEPKKEEPSETEKAASSDHYAPYNIDSDSETYDTEALSIMDINDIIGVQADTGGDSTLESEFAALSEIITDSKDEYAILEGNSAIPDQSSDNPADTGRKENANDSDTQVVIKGDGTDRAQSPSEAGNINKSLQLIGEAYISEDSRETEVEDAAESAKKFERSRELDGNSVPLEPPVNNEVQEKPGGETENASKSTVTADTTEGGKTKVCDDVSGPNSETSRESLKDRDTVESADSPDAAIIPEPEKPEDVEMMDVDSTVSNDPHEKLASPIQSIIKSGEKEGSNNGCTEEVKVPISEEAKLTNEPETAEEPMEVDEPHEVPTDSLISDAPLSDLKNDGESSKPDAVLISPTQPEVDERSIEASGDVVESPHSESVTEDSRTILEPEEAMEEKCNLEQPENPKDGKIDSERINDTEVQDPIIENKQNAENDATLKELIPEANQTKISHEPIEESRVEGVEENSKTQDHDALLSLENREVDAKVDSTSSKDIEKTEDVNEELHEQPEVASEPMEIDEPEQQENVAKNSSPEIEPISDCIPEDKSDEARGQETSNSTTKPLEPLEILESGESKIPCDSNADEISTDHSVPAVKSCVESSEVDVHSTKSPVVPETAETKISCSDSNRGENSADNSTPGENSTDDTTSGIKLPEESFAVAAAEPKESLGLADEDEKMEVDGSSKEKTTREEIEVTEPCTSPRDIREDIRESTKKEEIREETIEAEPSIDTVDDAPIPPEVEQTVPIPEKSVSSDTDVGRKIDPAECSDNVVEKSELNENNTHETVKEKEAILVEDTKISEPLNESSEKKETSRTEEESNTAKDENIVTAEEENLISERENNSLQNENIAEEMKNTSKEHDKIVENAGITEQKEDSKLDEETPQISSLLSELPAGENCPLEKANSTCDDVQPNSMEREKNKVEENQTEVADTSDNLEKIETQEVTEKIEADSKMAVDEEEIVIPSVNIESSENESQNCEPENQVEVANLNRKEIEIHPPDNSASIEKKEDSLLSVSAVPEPEEMETCKEAAELPSESQEANVTSIEPATVFSEETRVRSEEVESLGDDLELSVSPEPAEASNAGEKVKSIPPENIESSKPAGEATSTSSETPSHRQKEERCLETTDSLNDQSSENPNLPNMDVSNQELQEAEIGSEETQISHQNLSEAASLSEKDSTSRSEKTNDSTSSMKPMEPSSGEEKLTSIESVKNENEQIRNTPEEKVTHENEENMISAISETLSMEMQQDATSETIESLREVVKDSSITVEKVEDSMEVEEKSDSPATNESEIEVTKSPEQSVKNNRDENADSKDCEAESLLFVEGISNETETTQQEEKDPLDGKSTEESTTSMESPTFEANDQCNKDVELPIATAPLETQEIPNESDSRERDRLERTYEDQEMANENKTVTETISVDSDKKNTATNLGQLTDNLKEPSAYKSEETREEPQEKCNVDSEENLKDILSSDSVCVTQMFQDDEQSQSTQEMMESILETDKGNINNILDEQEVNDLEQTSAFNGVEKLSKESDNMLNKALEDPITATNIDSLEGLLDLDLIPETDETNLKSVEPIVDKVMQESCDDIETIDKDVAVALLLEENNAIDNPESSDYNSDPAAKIMNDTQKITTAVDELIEKASIQDVRELKENEDLTEKDLEAFDLASVVTNPLDNVDPSEDTKINLAEDLLREIAVDEESKIELTEKLLLDDDMQERDLLLSTTVVEPAKIEMSDEVFLPVEGERDMELSEDLSLDSTVRDQVLSDVAAEMENLPQNSEISELESAVKFLQESEEQDIDSSLVLSPKMVDDVVDDIVENSGVGIFTSEADICEDHSELVAELESIIPDPIAISEAEIINEAAKLEIERKTKLTEASKLSSPITAKVESAAEEIAISKLSLETSTGLIPITKEPLYPEDSPETRTVIPKSPEVEKIEREPLKKSAPIPKISILEERLKIPPKIEIPSNEPTRMCELPTTPKTSLLIQRDVRATNLTKQLESPKSTEKRDELRIVDTPRKDSEKHDFENVGSPRIILKIAKSAIADCSEPRSPKSPKIRSATNSPNPDDSPGQKLGKIKLKLSKSGHPSIISNDNFEEQCGQWHTEGSSSLSPLGMKIKFSKISDNSGSQVDKHEVDETREQTTSKHKFEEAKRTDSPLGMKIKLSRTGEPSIVQQETKDSAIKHKEKFDAQQGSPKRTESSIGMKIKLSKSGDASIIQPDKPETADEHKDSSTKIKEKLEATQQQQQHAEKNDTPRRTESPLGMKFKLFKTGDASIVQSESSEEIQQDAKRTDSPLGKKAKPMKTRSATSAASFEVSEETKEKLEIPEAPRRTESPLGMKIKLSKRGGDASIIHNDETRETSKPRPEVVQETVQEGTSTSKVKAVKSCAIQPEVVNETESIPETPKRSDATIGMKIKLLKSGDASIVHPDRDENSERSESHQENVRKNDTSLGVKIKLLKSGDASIIQAQSSKKPDDQSPSSESKETENSRANESPRTKFPKSAEGGIVETSEKKEKSSRRKETEMPIEMKIKLSRTGHPTIVACDNYSETQRGKESLEITSPVGTSKQSSPRENTGMKILKSMHAAANIHGNRSELTIEPIQLQTRKSNEFVDDSVAKRKDITISPIESKKAKHDTKLSHILPEVTIQPIVPRDTTKQIVLEKKTGSISRQQMNVISQEISITQVRSNKPMDLSMTDKLKSILTHNPPTPSNDCEIIEHRPELIIVNENSNSSQDVMIIEEVPAIRGPENKVPKKRGRPRRNPLPIILAKPTPANPATPIIEPIMQRDPLALDDVAHMVSHMVPQVFPPVQTETHGRPKRTCRNQKSYAPPRRGRGRGGRGKRKMDASADLPKRPRIDQDLDLIERSTTALITIHEPPPELTHNANESPPDPSRNTSELYKALRQPTMDRKMPNAIARNEVEQAVNETRNKSDQMTRDHLESLMDARIMSHLDGVMNTSIGKTSCDESFEKERKLLIVDISGSDKQIPVELIPRVEDKVQLSTSLDEKSMEKIDNETKINKDTTMDHENWLAPSSKKQSDGRNEANISNVQVMDEETRMSAESGSRSQTPAKNMSVQASETIVNEESQGSVLSTATTESEKVKVKNRRMEIHFDPDEGPFTVDKVAEYDWPLDPTKKNETFMIQEQISHYLGVKSFKRKYPDLKRRMVDMEERNYLRENGLVSEAMCDMGLTAVLSSEVLDIMCSDFPDQYEEYRKHIREKQMKEHFKKQKELTAAANAEKNRIDLAEMAVQSALSWNIGLNKARRESRKCSLDLQTFTIHVPKKQQKVEEESSSNHYPVALIPGQYTDYYREYTPAELRYYPLNTVLYGPMRPNERKFDSQSEGSQSDSDSDSSSDDSSSSSSEGTQDTEASQSTMDDVDAELCRQKEDIKTIKCKMCLKHLNKFSRTEVLIQCGTCNGYVHPSCIDLTLDMVPHIQAYAWQCTDCKTCAQCHDPADEDKMLFCDMCDRGYHIYCVGLRRVPQGRWHCQECAVCASCGSREAGGTNSDRNSVAQWQHEYKKGDKNTRVYVSTLCVPCSKLWRKGRYCPHCSRCHTVPRLDLEVNLVHCSACDKYLHLGCVETKDLIVDRKNYLCDFCQPLRHDMAKPLVSKVFKT